MLKLIFDNLKNYLEKLSDLSRFYRFELLRRRDAKRMPRLTKEQQKEIKTFYKRYHHTSTAAHQFYSGATGIYSHYYIPDGLWYGYIEPFYNPRSRAKSLDNKVLYNRILHIAGGVKHPQNIAYKIGNYWISSDYKPISVDEICKTAKGYKDIFLKEAEDSAGGHGVKHFSMPKDYDLLHNEFNSVKKDSVIQVGIEQHPIMASLNPSSVNTIRILSHLTKEGEIKIRSAIVRIGRSGSYVDNASSGGLTVGIDPDGHMKPHAYDITGLKYTIHPDTQIKFSSITIPNFPQIIDTIKSLQWNIPWFRLLSWDIALDIEGQPVLIEVNMHSGQLDFHQLNNGPVFGEDTQDVLHEVFGSKRST